MSGSSGGSAGDSAAEAANFEDYESDAYNVTAGSTGHPTMTGDSNQVDWSPSDDTADTAGGYEDPGGPASRTDVSSIHGESDDPGAVSYDPSIAAAQEREAEHLATGDADALVVDTYRPQVDIETIHGETDDPGSVSFDPTYDVETQEQATKHEVAKKELKSLMLTNEREVYCEQLSLKKDKRGSIRISSNKGERNG